MRTSPQRITVSSVTRHVHTWRAAPPRRAFHLTAPLTLPRKRSFFTSNPFLSQAGDDTRTGSANATSSGAATNTTPSQLQTAATTKRKPTRSSSAKNSLRRVAIIAQQQPKNQGGNGGGIAGQGNGAGPSSTNGRRAAEAPDTDPSRIISATCVAESFNMPLVLDILTSHGFSIDPDGTGFDAHEVVHARGVSGGDIFVFPSGTIVAWSLPPDVVTRQLLHAAEDPHPVDKREVEDLEFTADTGRETSTLRGDMVVLGTRREHRDGDTLDTTLAKIAFSSGLARSTKLAVLETTLTTYFESTRTIPQLLSQGAGVPLGRRFILSKTGELLSLRARLNHYSELTDSLPDLFWDSRSELGLEGYYDMVGRALDVNVRIRALNQKMDYAQEIASVLREMSSEQHGTRLELIIILLIAVEVVFELRRIILEWGQEREKAAAEKALAT